MGLPWTLHTSEFSSLYKKLGLWGAASAAHAPAMSVQICGPHANRGLRFALPGAPHLFCGANPRTSVSVPASTLAGFSPAPPGALVHTRDRLGCESPSSERVSRSGLPGFVFAGPDSNSSH